MMKHWIIGTLLTCLSVVSLPLQADERGAPLQVVASFSILGDMVAELGGERIQLTVLVGPDRDAHMYQPGPGDSTRIARADLVVINGLGFEGWIERLIQASGYRGDMVVATQGIDDVLTLEEDAEPDPHAWQSVAHARLYVNNIARGLVAADPAAAEVYRRNAKRYLAQLDQLEQEIHEAVAALPPSNRTVVTSHDAFGYFGRAYGLEFRAPQGMGTDSEASAKNVAALIRQIRQHNIPAIFVENIADPRLLEQIARETDATMGGVLYSDALSDANGPAANYLAMMRHNVQTLMDALAP